MQLRNSFVERQLSEFYSPIAGYRKRIRTKSELRAKISSAAQEVWQETCARYSDPEKMARRSDELFAPYKRIIEYDNQQFREELLPLYRKMLDVFTEKYWLADQDTRAHYERFLEFVEIWDRFLADALPGEVVTKLGHAEEKLHVFYDHLERKLSALQAEVKDRRFLSRI